MSGFSRLQLNSQGMAFDPYTGASYLISATGLQILRDWRDGRDDHGAARSLCGIYGVNMVAAARDIKDFRAQLRGLELD